MKKFLLSDLFFGILLTLFVAGSYVTGSVLLESLELKFYDIRAKLLQTPGQPPNEVAIVAIDDDSLAQLGRWPWPRGRVADMLVLERIKSGGAPPPAAPTPQAPARAAAATAPASYEKTLIKSPEPPVDPGGTVRVDPVKTLRIEPDGGDK